MNWEIVGSTGEWAGAIAVVATLFYLARQIQQSNKIASAQAQLALYESQTQSHYLTMDQGSGVGELRAKLRTARFDELSAEEREKLYAFAGRHLSFWVSVQIQYDNGLITEKMLASWKRDVGEFLSAYPVVGDALTRTYQSFSEFHDAEVLQPIRDRMRNERSKG